MPIIQHVEINLDERTLCPAFHSREAGKLETIVLPPFPTHKKHLMRLLDLQILRLADSRLHQNCTARSSPPRVLCDLIPFWFLPLLVEELEWLTERGKISLHVIVTLSVSLRHLHFQLTA